MEHNNYDFSVIIPHSDSLESLPRLFDSIPESDQIEIILIDNSPIPIKKEDVKVNRDFSLLFSDPKRGAGGARNEGLKFATGKWLVFLDADDYLANNATEAFYRHFDTDAEMVYFAVDGIYPETGEHATRGDRYTNLVEGFLAGKNDEWALRLDYTVPWGKMVRRSLVERNNIKYDEVIASNDTFFSLLTGYYATKVEVDSQRVYVVTVSKGSLTRRRDLPITLSRYQVVLRYNQFVKSHQLRDRQKSVMRFFYDAMPYGLSALFKMFLMAIKYNQNIFIGADGWEKTLKQYRHNNLKEKKYITK